MSLMKFIESILTLTLTAKATATATGNINDKVTRKSIAGGS